MSSGDITVLSPIPLSEPVKEAIAELRKNDKGNGVVKYIGLMNRLHHVYADDWAAAYPTAKFIGMESLVNNRKQQGYPELDMPYVFTSSSTGNLPVPPKDLREDFTRDFDTEYMTGHLLQELVYFHKPSRSLVQADLLYNFPLREQYSKTAIDSSKGQFANRAMAWNFKQRRGWLPWDEGKIFNTENEAWTRSLRRMYNEWDFDRIIPCHGDVIETDGKDQFRSAFKKWLS